MNSYDQLNTLQNMRKKLLIVDDETNIISALKRLFRRDDLQIFCASSGEAGLEILNKEKVGVIISDQMMPQMTGVEFLNQARKIQPDTIRIVLSGYTDLKTIVDSINKGSIWRFLTKPWEDSLIRDTIFEAFDNYDLKNNNRLLAEELKKSNDTLSIYNRVLETVIEEKTLSLEVNLKILQISQDILEQINVAIVCIDEFGMIVMTNRAARFLLSIEGNFFLGRNVKTILPKDFCTKLLNKQYESGEVYKNDKFNISATRLTPPVVADGYILILSANSGES